MGASMLIAGGMSPELTIAMVENETISINIMLR